MPKIKTLLKEGIFTFKKNISAAYPVKECPICGSGYFRFQTFNRRKNALCYHCRSMERDRLHYLFLKEKASLFDGGPKKMLHFAPETCIHNEIVKHKNIEYATADFMVTLNPKYQVQPKYIMSVTDIKFDDGLFDCLMCSHVLDDVDDDAKAISEIYRVVKTGGIALISVPIAIQSADTIEFAGQPGLREKMNISGENKRLYGLDIIKRLRKPGFAVQMHKASDFYSKDQMAKYAIRDKDVFYICEKP